MPTFWFISTIVVWVLLLFVILVLLSVLRNLGVVYESLNHLQRSPAQPKLFPGRVLPEMIFQTASGEERSPSDFRGTKTAFFVVSPQCTACHDLLRSRAEGNPDPRLPDTSIQRRVIVSIGDLTATNEMMRQTRWSHQDTSVLVTTPTNIRNAWGVTGTSLTIIADEQLRIIGQVLEGYDAREKKEKTFQMVPVARTPEISERT